MKVISFVNQKGGTGKTTSCLNVGACLADQGYKVLLIDADPQGSLTTSLAIDTGDSNTLYEVLAGTDNVNNVIEVHNSYHVIPTDERQSGAETELVEQDHAEQLIKKNVIEKLKKRYDFVLIDCPQALNLITIMSMTASSGVIVPLQAHPLAVNGLVQLQETVKLVKKKMNPALQIVGYVFTMYDSRRTLDRQVYSQVETIDPGKPFKTTISTNIALAEAPAFGNDIFEYDPKAKGATQYRELTAEIIERI